MLLTAELAALNLDPAQQEGVVAAVLPLHAEAEKLRAQAKLDTDEQQMTFEIHGLILALHYEARFLKTPHSVERALAGFERIVRDQQPVASATSPATVYPVSPLHTPATAVR